MVAPVRWSSVVVWCGIGVMSWCCSEAATALVVQRQRVGFVCLRQRFECVSETTEGAGRDSIFLPLYSSVWSGLAKVWTAWLYSVVWAWSKCGRGCICLVTRVTDLRPETLF